MIVEEGVVGKDVVLGMENDTSIHISKVWGAECCCAKAYLGG